MKRKSRRISNGFGYIGFGNKQSSFNQKNENPFTLLKERLHEESHYEFKVDFQNKKLSKLNENLLNQLDKNQTLLDQQQRLSLNNINNIKMLESELEEKKPKNQ